MKQTYNFFTFFIISFTFFLLWFIVSQYIGVTPEWRVWKTQIATVETKNKWKTPEKNVKKTLELSKFWEVYSMLHSNYYDAEAISTKKLEEATIKWLVNGLGDKHSEYLTKEETKNFDELLQWDFEWIWAVVAKSDYGVKLDMIFEGSWAQEAGLLKEDIIIKVDGEDIVDLELTDAIKKIKGPAGTKVLLDIYREWESQTLSIEVTRKKIDIPSVESEIYEGNIWYIKINSFWEKTADDVLAALLELKNTTGLIIDLRNNGGWYLDSATNILSNFVENGKVLVTTKIKWEQIEQTIKSKNAGTIYTGKIVILINENSASASEITAGALKDYDKAILVGKKSYGKGSVQVPYDLSDGSMLKLTVAKWFTPNDVNIDHEGINPDVEVSFTDTDIENTYDRQLEVAKKVLWFFIDKDAKQLSIDSYVEQFPENKVD